MYTLAAYVPDRLTNHRRTRRTRDTTVKARSVPAVLGTERDGNGARQVSSGGCMACGVEVWGWAVQVGALSGTATVHVKSAVVGAWHVVWKCGGGRCRWGH
eukprot:356138-Chlamydomonas_euryale.AAC.1